MPPVGFEPTILAGVRPQNYALDNAVTGTGILYRTYLNCTHTHTHTHTHTQTHTHTHTYTKYVYEQFDR